MSIDPELLAVLACPQDHGELLHCPAESSFYNPRLRVRYPIRDGIPVLMVDESVRVEDDAEHDRLVAAAQ